MSKYKLTISGDAFYNLIPPQPKEGYEEGTKVTINVLNGDTAQFKQFTGENVSEVINSAVYEVIMDKAKTIIVEKKTEEELKNKDFVIQLYEDKMLVGENKLKFYINEPKANITYESSDTEILDFLDDIVLAKKSGTVLVSIKCNLEGYNDKTYSKFIEVFEEELLDNVTKLMVLPYNREIEIGDTFKFLVITDAEDFSIEEVGIEPSGAFTTEKQSDGFNCTAVSEGSGKVKVKATKDDGTESTFEVDIKVKKATPSVEFNLNPATGDVQMNTTKEVSVESLTEEANWEVVSKNQDTATVAKKGEEDKFTITPVKEGPFTIDVIGSKEGMKTVTKSYTGNVTAAPKQDFTSLTINDTTFEKGAKGKLNIVSDPTGDGVTYTYQSSATDKLTVDSQGNYDAKDAGTSTVTVTAKKDGYNDKTATKEITITE